MDLGQKLHMSLDDLIKTRNDVQKKSKASEKSGGKRANAPSAKKNKQGNSGKLKMKAEPRKKLSAGKPRGEPATSRGGKRGQSAAGKRGLNSAVRVRFAPKVMGQSTQRQAVQEPPPAQNPSLASFVSSWTVRTNKDAHMALKVARQLEAMAQEKLGIQQPAPSRSGTNGRSHQRAVVQVDELVHRPTSQRGTRRATQQFSPPAEPANPLHDPSRYDHGWDEYVDDDMEEEDVKPSIAAMHQLRNRRGVR